MKAGLKITLIILAIALIAGSSSVYYIFNKPHRNIEIETPAYTIDAESLYNEFNKDEVFANQTYVDQVVQVSGTIVELFIDEYQISIVLSDNIEGVSCELDSLTIDREESIINSLKIGDQITLKGKCDGFDMIMGVVLTRCFIIP
jgi:hypothetical protein